ncbi:hypothetical protein J1TS5_25920 [Paenibacillus macerans]|uniref:hypothetical protein n=1 Tax=Paenibacillus macerans TaxID=44252 RepID=UPI001B125517|nr:hypothetical protein [Paenibacillus macerans]GIP10422.1 hypothetical protein J1TS5_25920 [Paenibacillus macerans]
MGKLIDADKLLAWLKIREGEAYTNADQVFNPSFLLGKADAFNDVVEYVKSGHSDLAPSPTIKPGLDILAGVLGKNIGYEKDRREDLERDE